MKLRLIAAAALALCAWGARYFLTGMDAQEVVRRLSGMRIAVTLYKIEHKKPPVSFGETVRAGNLEAAPRLKLPRHFGTDRVRDVPSQLFSDSGGWAYVNDPRSPAFGLVYIDCAHKDEKGRYWSEF